VGELYANEAQEHDLAEELKSRLENRRGSTSEDRRQDDHDLATPIGPGPRTGCHGDTVVAEVTITKADVTADGNNSANIVVTYTGKYTRQGWMKGCIQAPPPNGREDRDLSGNYTLRVHQKPFKGVDITWGSLSNLGEVPDPGHDSNVQALVALRNAINGAF
jgi:hypothetical protein